MDVKSQENEADLAERGAATESSRKGKAGAEKGATSWAEIVHSLGITPAPPPRKESMFTTEGRPNDGEGL